MSAVATLTTQECFQMLADGTHPTVWHMIHHWIAEQESTVFEVCRRKAVKKELIALAISLIETIPNARVVVVSLSRRQAQANQMSAMALIDACPTALATRVCDSNCHELRIENATMQSRCDFMTTRNTVELPSARFVLLDGIPFMVNTAKAILDGDQIVIGLSSIGHAGVGTENYAQEVPLRKWLLELLEYPHEGEK